VPGGNAHERYLEITINSQPIFEHMCGFENKYYLYDLKTITQSGGVPFPHSSLLTQLFPFNLAFSN